MNTIVLPPESPRSSRVPQSVSTWRTKPLPQSPHYTGRAQPLPQGFISF